MIGIFKQKNPANIILLFVFGVLIKLPMFMHPHISEAREGDGILFKGILTLLQSAGKSTPLIYPLLAYTLLFLQAIILTRFMAAQRMMSKSTYFPGMAYLLITSLFPEWNYF